MLIALQHHNHEFAVLEHMMGHVVPMVELQPLGLPSCKFSTKRHLPFSFILRNSSKHQHLHKFSMRHISVSVAPARMILQTERHCQTNAKIETTGEKCKSDRICLGKARPFFRLILRPSDIGAQFKIKMWAPVGSVSLWCDVSNGPPINSRCHRQTT